ncbi:hypothetical protein JVU11DRAFT_6924 [Chiua virens]|nr:hypothetical protein JVU11DRAFT_6924 [Chiua virens]
MDHEPTSNPSMPEPSGSEHPVPQPEHNPVTPLIAEHNNGYSEHGSGSGVPHSGSMAERRHLSRSEGYSTANPNDPDLEHGLVFPPPAHSYSQDGQRRMRRQTVQGSSSTIGFPTAARHPSDLDWIVPYKLNGTHGIHESRSVHLISEEVQRKGGLAWLACIPCKREKKVKIIETRQWDRSTIGERLAPTIKNAEEEREKCAEAAQWKSYAINVAIGLQVLLGALTTALAAAVASAKQASSLSTLVAAYLARVRGSGEPELSIMRVKDLEHFIRDCRAFELDHGHERASKDYHNCPLNKRLMELRQKFENLLGDANGERKLSATGVGPAGKETNSTKAPTA